MLNTTHSDARTRLALPTDAETRGTDDHHESLRLWLRLLTCTQLIEREIRARLRERFSITLARFDLMAQLERHPQGLRMGELSRRLMVTNGNLTGLIERLVQEGLVSRAASATDRRTQIVRLSAAGRRALHAMAPEHERWIDGMFAELSLDDRTQLHALLGKLRGSIRQSLAEDDQP